jgi:hypothetical protein
MLASHSSLENWSPEIMIEGSEGRAHWHIDQGLKIFSRAGTIVEEYPAFNYVNTMAHMYDRVLRRLTDNEVFICSTRIAAAHVACIAKIHEAAPICNIPPSELGTLEQGNASHTFVRNLEAHFRNAFSAGLLLREVNCPWGEAALTATRNAQFLAGGRSSSC